jgi:hypothetical protein
MSFTEICKLRDIFPSNGEDSQFTANKNLRKLPPEGLHLYHEGDDTLMYSIKYIHGSLHRYEEVVMVIAVDYEGMTTFINGDNLAEIDNDPKCPLCIGTFSEVELEYLKVLEEYNGHSREPSAYEMAHEMAKLRVQLRSIDSTD